MKCTSASGKTFYCIPTTRSPELHAYCYRNATPSLCASIDSCRISYTVICTVRRPILSRYEGHFSTKVTLKTVVFIILVLFRTSSRVPADLTQIEQNRRLTLRYYAITNHGNQFFDWQRMAVGLLVGYKVRLRMRCLALRRRSHLLTLASREP